MSIAEPLSVLKNELLQKVVPEMIALLASALQEGTAVHKVEEGLWDLLLRAGNRGMKAYLDSHGTGDLGPTLTLPNDEQVNRLEELHTRPYVSIFGKFVLQRVAYGSRESQAIGFVPLDNRLQFPESDFSYLLQDWDQELAVEQAFSKVNQTIERMLRLKQHTDCLENMNRQMAEDTAAFRDAQPAPPAAEEGQIFVTTADGKGVVIRGQGTPTVCGGQRPAGARQPEAAWPRLEPCIRSIPMYARPTMWWPHCSAIPTMRRRPGRSRVTNTSGPSCRKGQARPTAASTCSMTGCWGSRCCATRIVGSRRSTSAMAKRPSGKPGATTCRTRTPWTSWTSCT